MSETQFRVRIEDTGDVVVYVHGTTSLRVKSENGLLYDDRLYSFDGTFGKHGDSWYPQSGATVTGQVGSKVPKKTSDPITEQVAVAVNEHLANNPNLMRAALKKIFDNRTKGLQESVERERSYVDRAQKGLDRALKDLKDHLEGGA